MNRFKSIFNPTKKYLHLALFGVVALLGGSDADRRCRHRLRQYVSL